MNRGPGRHFPYKRRYLALLLIVALTVLVILHLAMREDRVEPRLAALRAAGYPTSFAELAQYTRLPDGTPNAAGVYARAFAAFVPPAREADVPILGTARLPDAGAPVPEAMAKAIRECLTANRECLALLHEAAGIEDCRYDWDYAEVLRPGRVPAHMDGVKRCSQLLSLSMVFHGLNDDTDAAVACTRDLLRLSDSLRREPGVVGYLLRATSRAVALDGLERALSTATFMDMQLQELDRMLAASAATLAFKEALITQRCFAIEKFRDMEHAGTPPLLSLLRTGEIIFLAPGIRGRGLPDTLDYLEKWIAAADLPLRERLARFDRIEAELYGSSLLHAWVKGWAPVFTSEIFATDPHIRVDFDLARTALALERYRLVTAELPEGLEQLVPQYLPRVPIDPFDGQPIRYRRKEPGYVVYSICADGQDNGGRGQDDARNGESYDWCFAVTRSGY